MYYQFKKQLRESPGRPKQAFRGHPPRHQFKGKCQSGRSTSKVNLPEDSLCMLNTLTKQNIQRQILKRCVYFSDSRRQPPTGWNQSNRMTPSIQKAFQNNSYIYPITILSHEKNQAKQHDQLQRNITGIVAPPPPPVRCYEHLLVPDTACTESTGRHNPSQV